MEEQTHYHSTPSGKVVVTWLFTKLLFSLFVYGFIFGFIFSKDSVGFGGWGKAIIQGVIAIVLLVFLYLVFLYRTYEYKITNKGIYFSGGIIVKTQKFVPFFKITNIETTQNIIEQMLGISKLGIQTAGTGGRPIPEITFEGLEDVETPKKLVYQMIEKTKKSSKYDE